MHKCGTTTCFTLLSKQIKSHWFHGPVRISTQVSAVKQNDHKQDAEAKCKADIDGLFGLTSNLVAVSQACTALPLQD